MKPVERIFERSERLKDHRQVMAARYRFHDFIFETYSTIARERIGHRRHFDSDRHSVAPRSAIDIGDRAFMAYAATFGKPHQRQNNYQQAYKNGHFSFYGFCFHVRLCGTSLCRYIYNKISTA